MYDINIYSCLGILFAHYVADFIVQTNEQSQKKSSSIKHLSAHCVTYGFTLLLLVSALYVFVTPTLTLSMFLLWVLVNTLAHFCVDFVTSKLNSKFYKESKIKYFWISLGFDQFLHYACLLGTYVVFKG